jgi:hypothetical protein
LFLSVKVTRALLVVSVTSVVWVVLPVSVDACVAGTLVGSGALVGVDVRVEHARPAATMNDKNANR